MRQQRRHLITGSGVDPSSLPGLELYLRADQVVGANGAAVAAWPDLSGHARTALQATGANQPTVLTPGSANGQRLIRFDGANDPNGDAVGATLAFPAVTNGYSLYFYGVWRTTINASDGAVLFADNTGGRPQLILDEAGGTRWGWRDQSTTTISGTTPADGTAHLLTWIFSPPADGAGICRVYQDGVEKVAGPWAFGVAAATSFELGNAGVVAPRMDLGACLWYSQAHNAGTRAGVEAFIRSFYEN